MKMNIPIWVIIFVILIIILFCNYEYSSTMNNCNVKYKLGNNPGMIYKVRFKGNDILVSDKKIKHDPNKYHEQKIYQNIGTKINKRLENAKKYAKQAYTSNTPLHDLYSSGMELSNCFGILNVFTPSKTKHYYVYVPNGLKINISIDSDNNMYIS